MPTEPHIVKMNMEVESIDIPSMLEMSDSEYRAYVNKSGLFFVDHHDVLRVANTGCPMATTREQCEILIDELRMIKDRLLPQSECR
ncbi:hypothetical protein [Planctellipticum variicoloris]|uniref:hypothetical protein n=1 Tax=Planctellipticum variicoloris TaxID=3064265 RepID=UPI0030136304|nr:hypothetical protein SH412_003090 [Planctomycetaceae bacterium SH412]